MNKLCKVSVTLKSTMATQAKKGSQGLSRGKETLLKAHEMGILCDVDVALFLHIRKSGRLITYNLPIARPGHH